MVHHDALGSEAIWATQPGFGNGKNQSTKEVQGIRSDDIFTLALRAYSKNVLAISPLPFLKICSPIYMFQSFFTSIDLISQ